MPRKQILVRLAASTCLNRCRLSPAPLTSLQDFLEELRTRGWDAESLSHIKYAVLADIIAEESRRAFWEMPS